MCEHVMATTLGTCFGIKKWDNFEIFDSIGFASPISTTCRGRIFDKCVVRLVVGG